MKFINLIAVIVLIGCGILHAQVAPQAPAKIAVVDTDGFTDEKTGIKRLIAAFTQITNEFKPRRDEIQALQTRYDNLVKTINDTQKIADPKTLAAQAEEAENLKSDIERKQQDGQKALEKRTSDLTGPIYQDINNALQAYAKARGLDMVFDVSKMQGVVMIVNGSVDITTAFITDYNAKHSVVPAGVPVKTTP